MLTASRLLNAALMSNGSQSSGSVALVSTIDQCCLSRYVVSLDDIIQANPDFPIAQLIPQLSPLGREKLSAQVRRHLKVHCELSGLEVHRLFSGTGQVMNLAKVRRLSVGVEAVYDAVLTFYARSASPIHPEGVIETDVLNLATIVALREALQPALAALRQVHLLDEDPRTIGFLTTQFHFATLAIGKRLKSWEQSLLLPYFRFAEEQVCVPWLEIAETAPRHTPASGELLLARQWIVVMDAISQSTYEMGCHELSEFRSTRGDMGHPQVAASVKRDMMMFQGYLLLCVLEGNMDAIQNHLLPLCVMVFPAVGVSWVWVDMMLRMMVSQIKSTLSQAQWVLLAPYADKLLEIFATEPCSSLGAAE
jgi:hypothetical protein